MFRDFERREKRQLSFALKCLKVPFNQTLFPMNPDDRKERFHVNFARTEKNKNSAVQQCQRLLNKDC